MDHLEYTELARHVVSFGSDWTERTAPEHILAIVNSQQVGEVRMPAGKLFDCKAPLYAINLFAKPSRQSRAIQFFAGTNRSGIGMGWNSQRAL